MTGGSKSATRARADGAPGSTRRGGEARTPPRSTLDGTAWRVNGQPGRARRLGGVRGEPRRLARSETQKPRLDAMGPKKRKAESTGLDEMDRELYQRFRAAANSVSSMYTSSLNLQKRAFNGGARHTTEKLLQWALSQQASGEKTISASDLIQALQAELVVLEGEDASLAAAGDSPVGVAPWTPSDRAAGATGRTRAHLAALDANAVRTTNLAHVSSSRRAWVFLSVSSTSFFFVSQQTRKLTRSSLTPRRSTRSGIRARHGREARASVHAARAVSRRAHQELRPGGRAPAVARDSRHG